MLDPFHVFFLLSDMAQTPTVDEQLTAITPHGTELRAHVIYSVRGPTVQRLQAVDPDTGVIHALGEQAVDMLTRMLHAQALGERAMGDLRALKAHYQQLAQRLGDDAHLTHQQMEITTLTGFVDVATTRAMSWKNELYRHADAITGHGVPVSYRRPHANVRDA